jgi:Resolvase, N terminal domain
MTSAEVIPAVVLKRKAVVYLRQSTQSQVMTNLESKRRQYDLVDVARQRGFVKVEIIDDDLGRSASGTVARPGFDRLVAWLCAGKVGAVQTLYHRWCAHRNRRGRSGCDTAVRQARDARPSHMITNDWRGHDVGIDQELNLESRRRRRGAVSIQ